MVVTGTSSFLFLLRVQAVYSHSKLVRYAFFVLWLVQISLLALVPIGVSVFRFQYELGMYRLCFDLGYFRLIIWHWLLHQHRSEEI